MGLEFRKVEEGDQPVTTPAPAAPGRDVEAMSDMADRLRAQAEKGAPDPTAPAFSMPATRPEDPELVKIRAAAGMARHSMAGAVGPVSVRIPAEVRLARFLWAAEYHASGLGMVDWWLSLDPQRKDFAAAALRAILD